MKKWDWTAIKLQYLSSEFLEVKAFFQHFYGTFNSTIKHRTIGWPADKKRHLKEVHIKATKIVEAKQAMSIEDCLAKILVRIDQILTEDIKNQRLRAGELFTLWKILRTEAGLPINYNCNGKGHTAPSSYEIDQAVYDSLLKKLALLSE